VRYPRFLPLLAAASMLFTACGVKFSDPPSHNEFFQSLVITGAMRAGKPLTAAVAYQTTYNVPVKITCELRQGTTVIQPIGHDEIPAYLAGNPKATPVPGNFAYDFAVDDPGSYKLRCYTDLDKDNFITKAFTVRPAQ
jgi:hypothetical protein